MSNEKYCFPKLFISQQSISFQLMEDGVTMELGPVALSNAVEKEQSKGAGPATSLPQLTEARGARGTINKQQFATRLKHVQVKAAK